MNLCDKDGNCKGRTRRAQQLCSEGRIDRFDDACQFYVGGKCNQREEDMQDGEK